MSKNPQISFAAMAHLAEGLLLNALLTLEVENSLICLVGTRIPTVSMMEWQLILPLKTLIIIIIIIVTALALWCDLITLHFRTT
jgi:hypothetical protein